MSGKLKLDLGCGQNKQAGFTGVDIVACEGVDVVHDLRVIPWPFENESVEEIFCSHFLEHLTGEERIDFMNECYRILIPGGKLNIITPYYTSHRSVQDPTHKWPPLCEASLLYFNEGWRKANRLDHYGIKCDFDYGYNFVMNPHTPYQINLRNDEGRAFGIAHYLNTIADIQFSATKRVPEKTDGVPEDSVPEREHARNQSVPRNRKRRARKSV